MSICPSSTEEQHSPGSNNYSREFRSMLDGLDEDGCLDEPGGGVHLPEKKRRLSIEQVKALEKNFEVENKLEPERKVKLAQELGLQPRQVAVWFQNRRARWKTKQLERDYGVLKANYDSLKVNFESLQQDNEALLKEIRDLKSKLNVEEDHAVESNNSPPWVKEEETMGSESDTQGPLIEMTPPPVVTASEPSMAAGSSFRSESDHHQQAVLSSTNQLMSVDFFAKDGGAPSDSDSSAILNEENSPNELHHRSQLSFGQQLRFNCTSSSTSPPLMTSCFFSGGSQHSEQPTTMFVKMEEHDFFSEEACNFYAEDHAPTLHNLYTAAATAPDHHNHWT